MASAAPEFILVTLAAIYAAAKVGSFLAHLARVPPLVGEILAGVAIANTAAAELIRVGQAEEVLNVFAELGVIFLIFTVGLETNLREMVRLGPTAGATGALGVVVPFAAGAGLFWALGFGGGESAFLGVAMVATSVGITARVLADMGALQTVPARIILGAAVLDDILGLLLLTIVAAAVAAGGITPTEVGLIVGATVAFFVVATLVGGGILRVATSARVHDSPHRWAMFVQRADFLVILAITLCLGLAAVATQFGLAAIIGAFLAGLLIETAKPGDDPDHAMEAIVQFLAPFFFVFIGLSVDVALLGDTLWLILGVTLIAILSKLIGCGIGSLGKGRPTALAVGIGMAPRGEVGIIVALLGLQLGIVGDELYGVVVAMSVLTTLIVPPLLVWAMRRIPPEEPDRESGHGDGGGHGGGHGGDREGGDGGHAHRDDHATGDPGPARHD